MTEGSITDEGRFDVAVIGAGPAGSLAAHTLARAGHRVALIDSRESPAPGARRIGESLPPAGARLLAHAGLGTVLASHLRSPGNLSLWGSDAPLVIDFLRDPDGPGWHLDRARFDRDLRAAALAANAHGIAARLLSAERAPGGWSLLLEGGRRLAATWIVDATGRPARIARLAGATRARDEELVAVGAWFARDRADRDARTRVEARAAGWWYTSPVPGRGRVAVLHTHPELARALQRDAAAWRAELCATRLVSEAVGSARAEGRLFGAEAGGARLDWFAGPGWIAVGDAALSFDPLSSQGVFNALYTGLRAGQAISRELGGIPALAEYGARLETIRAAYRQKHALVYASETRWADAPFWQGRLSMLANSRRSVVA